MIVPPEELQPGTLTALIEEFVTRHGAIHGHAETSLEAQIAAVKRQLTAGKAVIVFDEETESCSIVPADSLPPKDDREGAPQSTDDLPESA